MHKNPYLSVIVPVYNEEKLISSTLVDIDGYLKTQAYEYEIIAVNDGSSDGTEKVLNVLEIEMKNIKIISNSANRGKGYSVRKGMLSASGEYRLFTDADNSTDIREVKKFLEILDSGIDVAIGDRTLANSVISIRQPAYKKILGNIGNIFIRLLTIPDIKDTQCGFKCFSRRFVENVFPDLKIDRWAFDVEILALALKRGYKIKTIPIVWKNRSESRVKIVDYLFTLADIAKIKINLLTNKYERPK